MVQGACYVMYTCVCVYMNGYLKSSTDLPDQCFFHHNDDLFLSTIQYLSALWFPSPLNPLRISFSWKTLTSPPDVQAMVPFSLQLFQMRFLLQKSHRQHLHSSPFASLTDQKPGIHSQQHSRTLLSNRVAPSCMQLLFFFFNSFIYFWLRWVFVTTRGLSLVLASGGYSSLRRAGFSLWWLLLLRSTGSRRAGFSSCGLQAQ